MSEEISSSDWPAHIKAWKTSGLSQAAYCRQHDLCEQRLSYWKHKLLDSRSGSIGQAAGGNLVPVHLTPASPPLLKAYLPNGICLEGDSPEGLSSLIKLLRAS